MTGKNWDELKKKYLKHNNDGKNEILPSKEQMELLIKRKKVHEANPQEGISLNEFIEKHISKK